MASVEEEAGKPEDEGQHEVYVMPLVTLERVGQEILVAIEVVVNGGDAGYPIAVGQVAVALDVVLPAGEVPHEVAQIHEVDLV